MVTSHSLCLVRPLALLVAVDSIDDVPYRQYYVAVLNVENSLELIWSVNS